MKENEIRMEPLCVNAGEAARLLGVSKPKIYELMAQESFPAFRCGGRRLVSVEGLRAWVLKQTEDPASNNPAA